MESKKLQEAQVNVERILNHQMVITLQEQTVADNHTAKNL